MKVYIYHLIDPTTNAVRYVGKALHPHKRYVQHLQAKTNLPVNRWIRKLKKQGLKPRMEVVLESSERTWEQAERSEIQRLKESGAKLLNVTEGGRSVSKRVSKILKRMHEMDPDAIKDRLSRGRCVHNYRKRGIVGPRDVSVREQIAEHMRYAIYERHFRHTGMEPEPMTTAFIIENLDELARWVYGGVVNGPMIRESYERPCCRGDD